MNDSNITQSDDYLDDSAFAKQKDNLKLVAFTVISDNRICGYYRKKGNLDGYDYSHILSKSEQNDFNENLYDCTNEVESPDQIDMREAITEYAWIGAGWGDARFKLKNGKRYMIDVFFESGQFFIYELEKGEIDHFSNNRVYDPSYFNDTDETIEYLRTLFTAHEYDDIFEVLCAMKEAYDNETVEIFSEYFDTECKNTKISTDRMMAEMILPEKYRHDKQDKEKQ